jgi:raffinose/stachyose/melibiose transport system substrate-binding protein
MHQKEEPMYKGLAKLASILMVGIMLVVLAACGGNEAAPTTTGGGAAGGEATATTGAAAGGGEATATPAPAAGGAEAGVTPTASPAVLNASASKVFKIWHYEPADDPMGASWNEAMQEFAAKHPDVKVQFELKTFNQIQQTAQMILNSSDVPDVMEINKGNATAGLYAKQGLLTDLSDTATQRGWDKILNTSLQTTSRYDDRGIMGSGKLYGVTTYGEFVMVYYNKDMFAKYNIQVPTTFEEFTAACDTFVKNNITPIALGAAEYPISQNWYELALYKADRNFVTNYMTFANDVDFHGPEFTYASQELLNEFGKGYYSANATGVKADDAVSAFEQGKYPIFIGGSWNFGAFLTTIKDFQWGLFPMPGKKLNTGSGGNLLAVPANAKSKDLAYDFLDIALGTKAQTAMANAGGIPINADLSQITDPHIKDLNQAFDTILKNDGLAFYPDWPAPGYMDTLVGSLQELVTKKKPVDAVLDQLAAPWKEYKSSLP